MQSRKKSKTTVIFTTLPAFFPQLSAADVMMYEVFESSLMQDATLLDKFPKIKACRQKVQTCKKMEEYLGKRKQSPF